MASKERVRYPEGQRKKPYRVGSESISGSRRLPSARAQRRLEERTNQTSKGEHSE